MYHAQRVRAVAAWRSAVSLVVVSRSHAWHTHRSPQSLGHIVRGTTTLFRRYSGYVVATQQEPFYDISNLNECVAGKYSEVQDADVCTLCPDEQNQWGNGTLFLRYQNDTGKSSCRECLTCEQGQYVLPGPATLPLLRECARA